MALTINDTVIIDDNGTLNEAGFLSHLLETYKLRRSDEEEENADEID